VVATETIAPQLRVPVAETRRVSAGLWSDAVWRVRRDPTTLVALLVIVLFVAVALAADFLAANFFHRAFSQQDILSSYEKPDGSEPWRWLGTDELGRSQVVRLLYGARVSLFVGGFGALTALVIGLAAGVTAGYFRGWWDDIVVWLVTTLNSIPRLYLLLIGRCGFFIGSAASSDCEAGQGLRDHHRGLADEPVPDGFWHSLQPDAHRRGPAGTAGHRVPP